MKDFPSLPGLKAIYEEERRNVVSEPIYFISQKFPWRLRPLGTVLYPMQTFNPDWNNAQLH